MLLAPLGALAAFWAGKGTEAPATIAGSGEVKPPSKPLCAKKFIAGMKKAGIDIELTPQSLEKAGYVEVPKPPRVQTGYYQDVVVRDMGRWNKYEPGYRKVWIALSGVRCPSINAKVFMRREFIVENRVDVLLTQRAFASILKHYEFTDEEREQIGRFVNMIDVCEWTDTDRNFTPAVKLAYKYMYWPADYGDVDPVAGENLVVHNLDLGP